MFFSLLFMKKNYIIHIFTDPRIIYALLYGLWCCLSTCITQPSYDTILMGFFEVTYAFRFFSLAPTNPQNWNLDPVKLEEIVENSQRALWIRKTQRRFDQNEKNKLKLIRYTSMIMWLENDLTLLSLILERLSCNPAPWWKNIPK